MAPAKISSLAVASMAALSALPVTEAMLSLQFERRLAPEGTTRISRRDNTHVLTMNNNASINLYTTNVTVGTPPQQLTVVVDTGSSDFWVFGAGSCDPQTEFPCSGGEFDPKKSSSAKLNDTDGFEIRYGTPGSKVIGDYWTDTLNVAGISVQNQMLAVASDAKNVPQGILGLGYDVNEAQVSDENANPYPSFLDMLKNESLINSKVFSLWLDDAEATTGQVLLGGYDTSKFNGALTIVNQQPDPNTGEQDAYWAPWTGLSLTDSNGITTMYTNSDFQLSALMDSGTSDAVLPDELFDAITQHLDITVSENDPFYPCSIRNKWQNAFLNFAFGGATSGSSGNGVVQVPIQELFVDAYNNGQKVTDRKGNTQCTFGLEAASTGGGDIIFGDTFLRSAYVVYDLDNQLMGIAQTNFDASGNGSPQEAPSGGIASISGANVQTKIQIDATATAFSDVQTVTTSIGALHTTLAGLPTAAADGTTSGGNTANNNNGGDKKNAAGPSVAAPRFSVYVTVAATAALLGVGGMFVILV